LHTRPLLTRPPLSLSVPSSADEIIRQVTVNCAERGALLLRVRDEIRMTLTAYQALYESSVAFGMRKALMAEQKKSELKAKVRFAAGPFYLSRRSRVDYAAAANPRRSPTVPPQLTHTHTHTHKHGALLLLAPRRLSC
jgi:hypothetical protein